VSAGAWVLLAAVVVALAAGGWWTTTNGVFRGTHRVRDGRWLSRRASAVSRPPGGQSQDVTPSVLAGTSFDAERGERATLLQFSSAFCAPCRATRRILEDVARSVPGVAHVEVDAEHHLELVRALGVLRTPTTLVLDQSGREVTRATGAPRSAQVLAALASGLER
jgi:thiol-disulfide isomerase/thioredoxin